MNNILRTYRDAFSGLPRDTWLLSLMAFVNRSGTMVLPFLALYLTREQGFAPEEAGLLLGMYGLGSAAGTYFGGVLVDRLTGLSVLRFGLVAAGVGFFVLGQVRGPLAIGAVLLLLALLGDMARPATGSLVAGSCGPGLRTKAMTLLRLAINLGMAIGPALGGFLALVGYRWLFVVDSLTCLAAAALTFFLFRREPAPAGQEPKVEAGGRGPFSDRLFLGVMLLMMLNGMIFMQMLGTLPLYWREYQGFLENEIGLLFAVNPVLIVLFEMVLVHTLRHRDPLRLMGAGVLLVALGFGLVPAMDGHLFALVTVLFWTMGEMVESPQTAGFVANRSTERNRGRYMGVYLLTYSVALLLAPVIGTAVYQHLGPRILWWSCGVTGTLSGLLLLGLAKRIRR